MPVEIERLTRTAENKACCPFAAVEGDRVSYIGYNCAADLVLIPVDVQDGDLEKVIGVFENSGYESTVEFGGLILVHFARALYYRIVKDSDGREIGMGFFSPRLYPCIEAAIRLMEGGVFEF